MEGKGPLHSVMSVLEKILEGFEEALSSYPCLPVHNNV